ncbi:VanZ family protein [Salinimicrobium terrae]|uniref:VanZ family protein n=1 Tax=Salinimicrobium terrae TaxID=470866 RepID=UPI0006841EEA|nr:VanZ family protein [Salinimicrobium terrae]
MAFHGMFGSWSPRPYEDVKWYWIAFVLLTILTITFENLSYRAYISENNINDYGFSANSPNFFPIIAMQIFYFIEKKYNPEEFFKWCLTVAGFVIGYEILQKFIPARTFDLKDIIATVLASIIGYFLLKKLHTPAYKNKELS